jgi:HPt (histidine-containing phosphotransfer) domain-containing protein
MTTTRATVRDDDRRMAERLAEPPIDHAHLARYTLGNRALEIEVLQLFAGQAPDYLEDLRSAATEKAWRDAAHTLKGSARAVGAMRVAECAERAEALCVSADALLRARAIEALSEALAESRRHIAGLQPVDD